MSRKAVLAIGAHPDDIEFMMGGTLILLGEAGYKMHYLNICNGSCGTANEPRDSIVARRREEAKKATSLIGAEYHESLVDDIQLYYTPDVVARVGAIVREVTPAILLLSSPEDYMEDHMNASRVSVTAAFCRGMCNFKTIPAVEPASFEVTLYHALPHGLRNGMRKRIRAGLYVDISSVLGKKREMLAQHKSQKEWLDVSQGFDAYLNTMEEISLEVGRMSGNFPYAEGWRRHSHLGFSATEQDPLGDVLGERCIMDEQYETALNSY